MDDDTLAAIVVLGAIGGIGDTTAPIPVITSTEASGSYALPVPVTITFSEAVTGFVVGDITISGGSLAGFATADNIVFTVNWTPANGANTMDINAGVCQDAAGNNNVAAAQFPFTSIQFTIQDEYTTDRAAGAINGTNAEPTGGARVAVDSNSKLTISSGDLAFATGGGGVGDPGLWWSSTARGAGKVFVWEIDTTGALNQDTWAAGLDINQSGALQAAALRAFDTSRLLLVSPTNLNVGAWAVSQSYKVACVLRATGEFWFIKGGAFTSWTLLYMANASIATPLYPSVQALSAQAIFKSEYFRFPTSTFTVTPIASDAFTRADGNLGNTGGGGSEESGGSGLAWTAQKGTWGVATNKAACSALTDSVGIATVPCGTANVMVEVVATRAAGTSGLCLRYTDASNYIKCVHNGTNLQVIEIVNGTPNTLVNAAATYDAAARMVVSLSSTSVRAYYNGILISTATTAIATGNAHGLFTDDTGATFDNFVAWAKGNGSEYAGLDVFINP